MLILLLVFTGGIIASLSSTEVNTQRQAKTLATLALARDALIGYALTQANPGRLPCPEDLSLIGTPNEGNASGSCTLPIIGRLPWRSLKTDRLLDASGEPLWYVVSDGFGTADTIISTSTGHLTLDGTVNAAVALIIAPGSPLPGQNRSTTPPQAADYLDLGNVSGPNFQTTGPAATFNDQVLALTSPQLISPLEKKIVGEVAVCLSQYMQDNDNRLPWMATATSNYFDQDQNLSGYLPNTGDLNFAATRLTSSNSMDTTWNAPCTIISASGWWLNWKSLVTVTVAPHHKPQDTVVSLKCGIDPGTTSCLTMNNADKQFIVRVNSTIKGVP